MFIGVGAPTSVGLVQARFTSATGTIGHFVSSPVTIALPNPTLSGNCLVVCVNCQANVTTGAPSIADDKSSGIWTTPTASNTTGQRMDVFVGPNCPSGIKYINVTHTVSSNPSVVHYAVYEFCGIATSSPVDTSHVNSATAPNCTAGSMTTTQDGDLIFCYGGIISSSSAVTKWIAGTNLAGNTKPFELLNASNLNPGDPICFTQFGIQTTHGSINADAQCNGNSTSTVAMIAVALKTGNFGNGGSGMRIINVQGTNLYGSTEASGPWTVQFPTRGNLQHLSWMSSTWSSTDGLGSMSDTNGNIWTKSAAVTNGQAGLVQMARTQNATPTTANLFTLNADTINPASNTHSELYDIVNAPASAFDKDVSATGNQTSDTGTLSTVTITPTNANSLVICAAPVDSHCVKDIDIGSDSRLISDIAVSPSFAGSGSGLESDDGFAHAYNVSSSITFVYQIQNTGGAGVDDWSAYASAYKSS